MERGLCSQRDASVTLPLLELGNAPAEPPSRLKWAERDVSEMGSGLSEFLIVAPTGRPVKAFTLALVPRTEAHIREAVRSSRWALASSFVWPAVAHPFPRRGITASQEQQPMRPPVIASQRRTAIILMPIAHVHARAGWEIPSPGGTGCNLERQLHTVLSPPYCREGKL